MALGKCQDGPCLVDQNKKLWGLNKATFLSPMSLSGRCRTGALERHKGKLSEQGQGDLFDFHEN